MGNEKTEGNGTSSARASAKAPSNSQSGTIEFQVCRGCRTLTEVGSD